jgi:3-dehydroquinate synthetase
MLELIKKYQLPTDIPTGINLDLLLEAAYGDKKTENNLLTFVLTTCIGEAIIEKGFTKEKILGLLV